MEKNKEINMAKQLIFTTEAQQALKRGVDILASAVATTLGPKGRNVALDKKYGAPTVTHDGVTVAKEIELKDPYENMGAQLLKEAATKTNDVAGDGTTTATVLAQAIVNEGLKNVAAGANPMQIKHGLEMATDAVVAAIKAMSTPVLDKHEIANVASISAADTEIGDLIAEVMDKVGKDGVVTVEESKGREFETEYVEGMQFDRGYISAYFVTNVEAMEAVIENPYVLIHDKKISAATDIVPLMEKLLQKGKRDLVVIAEDVDGEALATLVLNKLRGTFNLLAVKAPGFGDRRKAVLQDIATLTGGTLITEELGRKLETVTIEDLGQAAKIQSDKDNTTIIEGKGDRGDQGPHRADQGRDRQHDQRLRQREAARAIGEVVGRRGHHPRGRGDRDRIEGKETSRGRCAQCDPCGGRGRHRARWRCGAGECDRVVEGPQVRRSRHPDGHHHHAPRTGRADAAHRQQFRPGWRRHHRHGSPHGESKEEPQPGLQRVERRVRGHGQERHHRSGQGHAQRRRERGQHRGHDPDHRCADHRRAGEEWRVRNAARWRHGGGMGEY